MSVVFGVAVMLFGAAGCGTAQREAGAETAAEEFLTALSDGDVAAACASLAPDTLDALVASEGRACEESLGSQELPGGSVQEVAVWSDRAQIHTDADVLFLSRFDAGWKVVAAGCRPQGERPYQCEVSAS